MNSLNDSVVVAILLTIVFGAICFYLYSRITQNEKRVTLLENLLLDFKITTEAQLMGPELLGPDSVEPISGPAPLESEDVDENLSTSALTRGHEAAQGAHGLQDDDEEGRYYQEMLRTIEPRTPPQQPPSPPSASPVSQQATAYQTTDVESRSAAVLEAARAAVATFASAKLENNYEAMSVKELQATVKQRGLSPVPRVRKDLIEMLKRHDAGEVMPTHAIGGGSSVAGDKITLDSFMNGDEQKDGDEGFSMSLNDGNTDDAGGLDAQFGGELTEVGDDDSE